MSVLELFFFKASNIYLSNKSVRKNLKLGNKGAQCEGTIDRCEERLKDSCLCRVQPCPRLPLQSGLKLAGVRPGATALLSSFCAGSASTCLYCFG